MRASLPAVDRRANCVSCYNVLLGIQARPSASSRLPIREFRRCRTNGKEGGP